MSECSAVACPDLDYRLERPGSVGRAMGPSVEILVAGQRQPPGAVGELHLAGPPTFSGYIDRESGAVAPLPGGLFPTGDTGYMDGDGYLYLTGRSKEVINRGGEIISPLEVEEVFLGHPNVAAVAAFSVPHVQLQEVVGLMVVLADGKVARPSRAQLIAWAGSALGPPKWPAAVVYTVALPVSSARKVVRIGMAERLGLPELTDDTPDSAVHFEVTALPDPREGNKAPIGCAPVPLDLAAVEAALRDVLGSKAGNTDIAAVARGGANGSVAIHVYMAGDAVPPPAASLRETLEPHLHGYLLPATVTALDALPHRADGAPDEGALPEPVGADFEPAAGPLEAGIAAIVADVLGCAEASALSVTADFFSLGGTSIQAGAIGFRIRDAYGVPANGALLYERRTVRQVAEYVALRSPHAAYGDQADSGGGSVHPPMAYFDRLPKAARVSSTSVAVLAVQLGTVAVMPLLTMLVHWLLLGAALVGLGDVGLPRLGALCAAIATAQFGMSLYRPLLAIGAKWALVGRLRPGRTPLWGSLYLRWWVADQLRRTCGRGLFDAHPAGLRTFYRLMGASIGRGVLIDPAAVLTEPDLVTLDDGVKLAAEAHLRPAAADCGDFLLAPIGLGERCSVGRKATLAPGTVLPPDTHLRPCSSSWEAADDAEGGCGHAALCAPSSGAPPARRLAIPGYFLLALPHLAGLSPILALLHVKAELLEGLHGIGGAQVRMDHFLLFI